MDTNKFIPAQLQEKYEFYSYGHALEILHDAFPDEWQEIQQCLEQIKITINDIKEGGGSKSQIPKHFDDLLFPLGWREIKISGDLIIKKTVRSQEKWTKEDKENPADIITIAGYVDGHNIDFVKNKVAFDLEWNSKDQTFDRDLLAMRTYFDSGIIDVGIIVTRSEELNEIFNEVIGDDGKPIKKKYGASTTWIGKLLPRLNSRRNGGCPILAIGIRKGCVEGYE